MSNDKTPKINFDTLADPGVAVLSARICARWNDKAQILGAIPYAYANVDEPLEIELPTDDINSRPIARIFVFNCVFILDGALQSRTLELGSFCTSLLELLYREAVTYDKEKQEHFKRLYGPLPKAPT